MVLSLAFALLFVGLFQAEAEPIRARAVIFKNAIYTTGEWTTPLGIIDFIQNDTDSNVTVSGYLWVYTAGYHGFHVHTWGDFAYGCIDSRGHYDPLDKNHGPPNPGECCERHVGDLGNIYADRSGLARIYLTDHMIKLSGEHSIVGRSMVVHARPDDLGKGGLPGSLTTGNAGARLGCGIVGLIAPNAKPYGSYYSGYRFPYKKA